MNGYECPLDGGEGFFLGQLGTLDWFRCRSCGINYSLIHVEDDEG